MPVSILGSFNTSDATNITHTHPHTLLAGTNRVVMVLFAHYQSTVLFSSITYNGVAMHQARYTARQYDRAYLYYLKDAELPSSPGTYNMVLTMTASERVAVSTMAFQYVSQTTVPYWSGDDMGASSTEPDTISFLTNTSSTNDFVVSCGLSNPDGAIDPSTYNRTLINATQQYANTVSYPTTQMRYNVDPETDWAVQHWSLAYDPVPPPADMTPLIFNY